MIWDENTYLMVDWNLVAVESNTSMVREEAFKQPAQPLVRLDDRAMTFGGKAESIIILLIIKQEGMYRAWYELRGDSFHGLSTGTAVGYAESDDGLHFKPVRMGQVSFDGSKRNNLIHFNPPSQPDARQTGFLHDPLDRDYPFKCVYVRPARGADLEEGFLERWPWLKTRQFNFVWGIGRSRDGLVWEPPDHAHDLVRAAPENAKLHRALNGELIIADQMCHPTGELVGRHVKGWLTRDLVTAHRLPDYLFRLPDHMCRVHASHSGLPWNGSAWVQPHVGLLCARKGPTIIGLHGYLYGATAAETFAQTADIGLACSSTGIGFSEVWPFRPFVRRGMRGEWDFGMVAQAGIVDDGDQTRFYYTGGDVGNLASAYLPGLAHIPRDRYGYRMIKGHRNAAPRRAHATLQLNSCVLPKTPGLAVNVSHVTPQRHVRLALADENNKPIRGYSFANCMPITREGLRRTVKWKGNRTARELAGRTITIHAELTSPTCRLVYHDSPRLYAIYTGR